MLPCICKHHAEQKSYWFCYIYYYITDVVRQHGSHVPHITTQVQISHNTLSVWQHSNIYARNSHFTPDTAFSHNTVPKTHTTLVKTHITHFSHITLCAAISPITLYDIKERNKIDGQ